MAGHAGALVDTRVRGLVIAGLIVSAAAGIHAQTAQAPAAGPTRSQRQTQARTVAREEVDRLLGSIDAGEEAELARQARAGIEKAVRAALVERAVVEPLTGSTQAASQQQLTIVAEKGDVNGRARFSIPLGPSIDGQLTFTGPLAQGGTTFATADGLSANASVNGSLKWTVWNRTQTVKSDVRSEATWRTLREVVGVSGASTESTLAALERARRAIAAPGSTRVVASEIAFDRPAMARLFESPGIAASPQRYYAAVVQQMPELTSTAWAGYITAGIDSSHRSIEYLNEETFETASFDKTTQMFTLAGGVSRMGEFRKASDAAAGVDGEKIKKPLFYAGTAFRGGDSVNVADSQKICRPLGTGGASECVEGPVGEPTHGSTLSWTGELRFWSWGALQSVGFNPRYSYSRQRPDAGSDRTVQTVEAPIYFMHQVKDVTAPDVTFGADLIGGVSVGWRRSRTGTTTKEGAFVTLFLTKSFGLP